MSRYPPPSAPGRRGASDTDQFLPDNAPPSSFPSDRSAPSLDRYSGDSSPAASSDYGTTDGSFGSDPSATQDGPKTRMRPFEMQMAKQAIQRHIDQGDITQHDVDVIKESFQTTGMGSVLGAALGTFGTVFYFRRRRVPAPLGIRLGAIMAMGMTGSFIGFACGGMAATQTLRKELGADVERKVQVLGDIAEETRAAQIERLQQMRRSRYPGEAAPASIPGAGRAYPPSTRSTNTNMGDEDGSARERRAEYEREQEGLLPPSPSGVGGGGRGVGAVGLGTPTPASGGAGSVGSSPGQGQSAWDRIRSGRPANANANAGAGQGAVEPAVGGGAGAGTAAADYARQRQREQAERAQLEKEQREFDEMLERERRGGASGDKWR